MGRMDRLEPMDDFFTARVASYDAHMPENVQGCRAGYEAMAAQAPLGCRKLLALGCGTGLELEPIFRRFPCAASFQTLFFGKGIRRGSRLVQMLKKNLIGCPERLLVGVVGRA